MVYEPKRKREQSSSSSEGKDDKQKPSRKKEKEVEQTLASVPKGMTDDYESILKRLNINDGRENEKESDVKKRLLIGEGSLSFALAMARKHPKTAKGIHATTYENSDDNLFKEGSKGAENKAELEKLGVKVTHGFDIKNPSSMALGEEEKYDSMHFNYPRTKREPGQSTKELLEDYAQLGYNHLKEGGKLRYTLPSSESYSKNSDPKHVRNSQYGSKPIETAQQYCLKFHRKLGDPQKRYGDYGYSHEKTGKTESRSELTGHEYILKKQENDMSWLNDKNLKREFSDIDIDAGTDSEFESD